MTLLSKVGSLAKTGALVFHPRYWRTIGFAIRAQALQPDATCSNCSYHGSFATSGVLTPRMSARCPRCGAMERHRLLALAITKGKVSFANKRVLHFAPEKAVEGMIKKQRPAEYVSADLDGSKAMVSLNIESLEVADGTYDIIFCSHVLEHVDDAKALSELHRVLAVGGAAVLLVPLVEGWDSTYENDQFTKTPDDRATHFGQDDHIRYYGRDFRDRVKAAGFELEEFTAEGSDSAAYGLLRGEKIFLASKI